MITDSYDIETEPMINLFDFYGRRGDFADLDVIMKTVHLAGVFQNRVLKHINDGNLSEYFMNLASNLTIESKISAEKSQLKKVYENFKAFYKQHNVERHDDVAICQIQGAAMRLEKQFHSIDYVNRPNFPNGNKFWGPSETVYSFMGYHSWPKTHDRSIKIEEAQAIINYYKNHPDSEKRKYNFYEALVNDGGIKKHDAWSNNNENAILLQGGQSYGKSGYRRVLWVNSFFGGNLGLRYGDKSDEETGGRGRRGDTHMGALLVDSDYKDTGCTITGWQDKQPAVRYISILKK